VDPAARAQVEHGLALVQVSDRGRVAASEAREHGRLRELLALQRVVQRRAEPGPGVRAATGRRRRRGLRVVTPDVLPKIDLLLHRAPPFTSNTVENRCSASGWSE